MKYLISTLILIFILFLPKEVLAQPPYQTATWSSTTGCSGNEPSIEKIFIDACYNPEGKNEFMYMKVGNTAWDWSTLSMQGSISATICSNFTTSAAMVATLNAGVGTCPGNPPPVFKVAPNPIPAGAIVAVYPSSDGLAVPPGGISYLCGKGPVYVISGNFVNPPPPAITAFFRNGQSPGGGTKTVTIKFNAPTLTNPLSTPTASDCVKTMMYDNTAPSKFPSDQGGNGSGGYVLGPNSTIPGGVGTSGCYDAPPCVPPPAPMISPTDVTICNTTPLPPVTFSCSNCGNFGYNVYAAATGGSPIYVGDALSIPLNLLPGSQNTILYFELSGFCPSLRTPVMITKAPVPNVALTPTSVSCNGSTNGSISLVPSSGTPPYTNFSWSPAGTGQNPNNLAPGTYTVTVTDNQGCTNTAMTTITEPLPTNVTATSTNSCPNSSTGSISTTSTGPNGPFTYQWSPTLSGANPTNVGTGTYIVTATNANGCTATNFVTVNAFPLPSVSVTPPAGPACTTSPTPFTFIGTPAGGVWSGNAPGGVVPTSASSPVTVTYTVTDANGCTNSATAQKTITTPVTPVINSAPPACVGTGPITLNASPAGGVWSGATTNGTIQTTASGPQVAIYTATDANGCSSSQSVTVTVNATPTVTINVPAGPYCTNNSSAYTFTGTPSGGTWGSSTPGGFLDAGFAGAGNTVVTYQATAANGCTGSSSTTVVVNASPIATLPPAGPYCIQNTNSIALAGSPAGGVYGGSTTTGSITPSVLGVGSHVVTYTVTGAGGCSSQTSIVIQVTASAVVNINGPTSACVGGNPINLTGTPAGGTWSGATTNGTVTPSTVGPQVVNYLATDALGCTGTKSVTITVNPLPTPTITLPLAPYCSSSSVGLTFVGNPSAGGNWSSNAPNGVLTPSSVGAGPQTVYFTATDANGCTSSTSVTIVIAPSPTVVITPSGPFCVSDNTSKTLVATPTGGVWTGSSTTGSFVPSALGVGTHTAIYTFTSTDGCPASKSVQIVVTPPPTVTITTPPALCKGSAAVTLTGNPSGGVFGGSATPAGLFDPTTAGTFPVTYTYTNPADPGCSNTANTNLTVNNLPAVTINNPGVICTNAGIKTLTGTPSGGTWSGDASVTGQINPANGGPFNVTYTATDNNGCSNSTNIIITTVAPAAVSIAAAGPFCQNSGSQPLSGTPSGGVFSGTGVSGTGFNTAVPPGANVVTYNVTDANGCTNSATTSVTVIALPTLTYTGVSNFCQSLTSATLTAVPAGGTWSGIANLNGSSGAFNPSLLGSGSFTATYTYADANNCSNTLQVPFTILAIPTVSITSSDKFCNNLPGVNLSATPTGGVWGGAANANGTLTTNVAPGNYTVNYTYTIAPGCSSTATQVVTISAAATVTITAPTSVCESNCATQFVGSPSGGTFAGTISPSGLFNACTAGAGAYNIAYFVNQNGCASSAAHIITVYPKPSGFITGNGSLCGNNAFVNLGFNTVGAYPLSVIYALNGTAQAPVSVTGSPFVVPVNTAGTYTVVSMTDPNGCVGTATGQAVVTTITAPNPGTVNTTCNAAGTTYTVTFKIFDGSGNFSFLPSNGGAITGNTFTSNPITSGTGYNFTVEDDSGCTPFTVSGTYKCNCVTAVGTMNTIQIDVCGPGTATATYNSTGQNFDPDDVVKYYLHTGSSGILVGVIASSDTPTFSFTAPMQYETKYYISAVVGSAVAGAINLNDACLKVSAGTPVVFHKLPTAAFIGNDTICKGETGKLKVDLTSNPSYKLVYKYGSVTDSVQNISLSPFTINLTPSITTIYTLVSVTDKYCKNTASGSASIYVNNPPSVTVIDTTCNNVGNAYQIKFTISGGDATSYSVTPSGGTLTGANYTSAFINTGASYSFKVDDKNKCGPAEVKGNHFCDCTTAVGSMSKTLIEQCGTVNITATYSKVGEVLDGDDNVLFVLHSGSATTLIDTIATSKTPSFGFKTPPMLYGTTYYISAVAASVVNGAFNWSDPCKKVAAGTPIVFHETPTATLSGTKTICEGDSTELTIVLKGQIPFEITYNDGTKDLVLNNIISNTFKIIVNPKTTTTYTIKSVKDKYCTGTVSGTAVISVKSAVQVSDIEKICNGTSTAYQVTFKITGGDAATYKVTGGIGTITNGVFTSTFINSGLNYNFVVNDANNCAPQTVAGKHNCDCKTKVGTMNQTAQDACVPNCITATYVKTGEVFDANDTISYVLHTNASNQLGTVIKLQKSNTICFDAGTMIYGTVYYLSAVAGNNVNGLVDIKDDCLAVSEGTPVRFYKAPRSTISGSTTICQGDEATLTFVTTGIEPFKITYFDGITNQILTNVSSPYTVKVKPNASTNYKVTSVFDGSAAGCEGIDTSVATIKVGIPPTADIVTTATICNAATGGSELDFDLQVTKSSGGTWTDVNNSGATGTFPKLNFAGIKAGTYTFKYTTNTAVAPCVNQSYTITVTVNDCKCLDVTTSAPKTLCNDGGTVDLKTITVTTEAGVWSITSAPSGTKSAKVTGTIFDATGADAGEYTIRFTLTATPSVGCPKFSQQKLKVEKAAEAGTSKGGTTVCSQSTTLTKLIDLLSNADNNGVWTDVSVIKAPNGTFDATQGTFATKGIPIGTYTFKYEVKGAAPCPDDMETVEVKVSDAFTSGVASAPTVLCSADSKLIKLRDELTGESDGGKWTTNATTGWDATLATFNTQLAKVGIYTFEYKFDANGACAGDDETVKVTINETPTAEAGKDDAFNCDKTSITLGGNTTSGGGDIELSWTPNNGGLSSTNTAKPSVNKPGTYILTVKNTKTGCTAMDTITIKSNTNVPTGGNIKLVNPKCFGEANGTITVENIVGGTPPYLYAINGGTFAANSTISGLKAGTFKVSILDATGCEWSTTATLTDPKTTVTLELGDDKYISLGDSVKLKPTTSINDGTLLWTNATTLSCDKCISPVASPLTSTIYSAQLTDKNGCTATDRIGVFVEIKKPYIPNAFSPNGDGNNDVFTIFIDPKLILKVNFLRVYDRWGNLVFDQQDFKPNDITTGWNGAYRGKDMNSDVFAYVCEIEYKNGQKILYKGDVTLTR